MHKNLVNSVIKKFEEQDLNEKSKVVKRIDEVLNAEKIKKDETPHDKWRRRQLSSNYATEIIPTIHNKKENISNKLGLSFEGNVKTLARKYVSIDEIFKRMTLGQLRKYYVKDNIIYELPDKKPVYDENTKQIFD